MLLACRFYLGVQFALRLKRDRNQTAGNLALETGPFEDAEMDGGDINREAES